MKEWANLIFGSQFSASLKNWRNMKVWSGCKNFNHIIGCISQHNLNIATRINLYLLNGLFHFNLMESENCLTVEDFRGLLGWGKKTRCIPNGATAGSWGTCWCFCLGSRGAMKQHALQRVLGLWLQSWLGGACRVFPLGWMFLHIENKGKCISKHTIAKEVDDSSLEISFSFPSSPRFLLPCPSLATGLQPWPQRCRTEARRVCLCGTAGGLFKGKAADLRSLSSLLPETWLQ